ncbi:hypothetical protein M885DRAFT_620270 [Pelagophyceae sp. CCMP2097]|nr:hypothetical protein M885DRAFT_620270 [Pelagophyceae sp. CCMP2097]
MDDAFRKAQELAARLSGQAGFTSKGNFSTGPPMNAMMAGNSGQFQGAPQQAPGQQRENPNTRFSDFPEDPMLISLQIAFSMRKTVRETKKLYIPHVQGINFMGLLLGPRGSSLKDLVDRTGARIVIRGRGSQREGERIVPHDDDDDEMHVAIEGPADAVHRACAEVDALLSNPHQRMQQKQAQGMGDMSGALTLQSPRGSDGGDYGGGGMTPRGGMGMQGGMGMGGGGADSFGRDNGGFGERPTCAWEVAPMRPSAGETSFECRVPNSMVGLVIGRGGENIKRISAETTCRLQIAREAEPEGANGVAMRRIGMIGSPQAVDRAKEEIEGMLRTRNSAQQQSQGGTQPVISFKIPNDKVGLVIGKAGSTVRGVQDRTGTNIRIPPQPDEHDASCRTLTITAPTQQHADNARREIEQLIQNEINGGGPMQGGQMQPMQGGQMQPMQQGGQMGGGGMHGHPGLGYQMGGGGMQQMQQSQPLFFPIPDNVVGLVIGKGGETINKVQGLSGCRIQIPTQPDAGSMPPVRTVTVTGPEEGKQRAQYEIMQIITQHQQQHPAKHGSYGGGGGGGGGGQQMQQMGDPYAQQMGGAGAMLDPYAQPGFVDPYGGSYQQQMQMQQMMQMQMQQQSPQQPPQQSPQHAAQQSPQQQPEAPAELAPDAYYQDFWNYVGWYGEEAARGVYGAYAPPPGTAPPPGIVAPPAQAQPAAPSQPPPPGDPAPPGTAPPS